MSYQKNIHVYRVNTTFNAPYAENPKDYIALNAGDIVVTVDDEVWVRERGSDDLDARRVSFDWKFVQLNEEIFHKVF